MYYRVDTDMMHEMGLQGREAMVYSALLYLCKNAPWEGTYTELAKISCCGDYMTALRMLERLQQRGYIYTTDDGICITQNEHTDTQNEHFSKEKRTKKENIIKENNEVSVCINAREETHTGFAYRRSYK